jgi:hypothetical protein
MFREGRRFRAGGRNSHITCPEGEPVIPEKGTTPTYRNDFRTLCNPARIHPTVG